MRGYSCWYHHSHLSTDVGFCADIYPDLHPGNLLACADEDENNIFQVMDDHEKESPSTRKQVSENRTIYASRALIPKEGPLKLSDFGESRIGPGPYEYKALPMVYRAPEIMIEVPWSYPIDIWCVGMTVCLFVSYSLLWVFCFRTRLLIVICRQLISSGSTEYSMLTRTSVISMRQLISLKSFQFWIHHLLNSLR